jgi:two-component system, OmpR family, KDP operon response regulator KdpE
MTQRGNLVLVVDDEPQLRRFIRASLMSHGYRVIEADCVKDTLAKAASQQPDLILLDLGLPDGSGIDLTKQLRDWTQVPIIIISARGREADKVEALDAGAGDYLTKPFGVNELLARMRVAQRYAQASANSNVQGTLEFGDLQIDFVRREVQRAGVTLHLTPMEYKLISLLARHAGQVLTHRQILTGLWGPGHAEHTHYVRVQMAELRKKVEADPARPKLLITEPGVGYRLRDRV